MRNQKIFRYILLLTLLVAFSLSCKVITKPIEDIIGIKNTAESIATSIDVEGIATSIEGLATEIDIEGISTQIEPMITEVQEMITEMPDLSGEKPADIPIIEGGEEMIATKGLITYSTVKGLGEVVDFYERQMPVNGWVKTEGKVEEDTAKLVFQKEARKATITIDSFPIVGTTVSITIEGG